jgi:hypothetical protein
MEVQKDPGIKKMFIMAFLIISLMAQHCGALQCYACGPRKSVQCEFKPRIETCSGKQDSCVAVFNLDGKFSDYTKGCFNLQDCQGFTVGCGQVTDQQVYEASYACQHRQGGFKGSVNITKSRQTPGDATKEACACKTDLCNGDKNKDGKGKGPQTDGAKNGAVFIKMTTAGLMIIMINIAIAASSMIC